MKKPFLFLLIIATYLLVAFSGATKAQSVDKKIYRLRNSRSGVYLYTADINEISSAVSKWGYIDEGVAWTQGAQQQNIYRLRSPTSGVYLYTANASERVSAVSKWGYIDEGIAWVDSESTGTTIYRLRNSRSGVYLYTADINEISSAVSKWGYIDEGVAWTQGAQQQNIYRLRSPTSGVYLYTANASERVSAVSKWGYIDEGIAWVEKRIATKDITAIGPIMGNTLVGSKLTAGILTPSNATVSYQWQSSATVEGSYSDISGATSSTYTIKQEDKDNFIKVRATGTGLFASSVASSPTTIVHTLDIESIGDTQGINRYGATLTAGSVTPSGATVSYAWKSSPTIGNDAVMTDLPGATAKAYTIKASDIGKFIWLTVKGVDGYSSELTSLPTQVILPAEIESTGSVSGSATTGERLWLDNVTPSEATATYQWQVADLEAGPYVNIESATTSGYSTTDQSGGKYIRVAVTGTENYSGTKYSSPKLIKIPINDKFWLSGNVYIGETKSVMFTGIPSPDPALYSCKWERSDSYDSGYQYINDANSCDYTIQASDLGKYLGVEVTGSGKYTGTSKSKLYQKAAEWGLVNSGVYFSGCGSLCAISTSEYTQPVEACSAYATVTGGDGSHLPITSTVSSPKSCEFTFTAPNTGSYNVYLSATTSNSQIIQKTILVDSSYVFSPPVSGTIAIEPITGVAAVGNSVSAGWLTPSDATAVFQWQISNDATGEFTDITDATNRYNYTIPNEYDNKYLRLKVTGTAAFLGQVTYSPVVHVSDNAYNLVTVAEISGGYSPVVDGLLHIGWVSPEQATVSYQWQRSDTKNGTYVNIPGATLIDYRPDLTDLGKYLRVIVAGTGSYQGTLTSEPTVTGVLEWGPDGRGRGGGGPCAGGMCFETTLGFSVPIVSCPGGYAENIVTHEQYSFGAGVITEGDTCTYTGEITVPGNYRTYIYANTNADVNEKNGTFFIGENLYQF